MKSMVASRDCSKPHQSWFGACRKGASGGQIVHLSTLSFLRRFSLYRQASEGTVAGPEEGTIEFLFLFLLAVLK